MKKKIGALLIGIAMIGSTVAALAQSDNTQTEPEVSGYDWRCYIELTYENPERSARIPLIGWSYHEVFIFGHDFGGIIDEAYRSGDFDMPNPRDTFPDGITVRSGADDSALIGLFVGEGGLTRFEDRVGYGAFYTTSEGGCRFEVWYRVPLPTTVITHPDIRPTDPVVRVENSCDYVNVTTTTVP